MPSCLLCSRSKNSTAKLQNITFHKFPTIQMVKEKWCNFVVQNGLKISDINQHSLICSNHFEPSLFITHSNSRRLPKTAVPNIMITRMKNAKEIFPEITRSCQKSTLTDPFDVKRIILKLPANEVNNDDKCITPDELPQLDISMQSNVSYSDHIYSKQCHDESSTIQVIANNISCEGVSPLDESMQSNIFPLETSTVEENMNSSYLVAASNVAVDDTPRRKFLKQGIHKLSDQLALKNRKLKVLQQNVRRKEKQIASMKSIILQLKEKNLITEDASDILLGSFGKHKDLITNWSKKKH